MHFLMVPLGTSGDMHPFLAIAQRLRHHGHEATFITHSHFIPLVREMGFGVVDLKDEPAYSQTHNDPNLWHPRRGSQMGARFFLRHTMRASYQAITDLYKPGETIAVSNHSGFGCRMAHDDRDVPYITLQTSPAYFFSVVRPPRYGFWSPSDHHPEWIRRAYYWVGNRCVIDRLLGAPINEFRAELGLGRARNLLWWHMSPQLIIGLFPRWFAEPRPEDWPEHLVETEFPLFDEPRSQLPPDLEDFLEEGTPPVVFTPGTGVACAGRFFTAAVAACKRLNLRGLFLSRFDNHIPPSLPQTIRHFPYIPLGAVLPRCRAIVYHGGIGTLAQAIRAGIPHVVMPMAHDQPDNGHRLARLGVGKVIWPKRFNGATLAAALSSLLHDPEVHTRCRELAARIPADPVAPTVQVLEEFAARMTAPK
jgi:UDP:flavonoid glycosyltransferase YjiC (YdhE family)